MLEYVLRFVGFTPDKEQIKEVADSLRELGSFKSEDKKFSFRIVGFRQRHRRNSKVKIITLDHVLDWIDRDRFQHWRSVKTDRQQWDKTLQGYILNRGGGISLKDIEDWC